MYPVFMAIILFILFVLGVQDDVGFIGFTEMFSKYYHVGEFATIPSWRWHLLFSIMAFLAGIED